MGTACIQIRNRKTIKVSFNFVSSSCPQTPIQPIHVTYNKQHRICIHPRTIKQQATIYFVHLNGIKNIQLVGTSFQCWRLYYSTIIIYYNNWQITKEIWPENTVAVTLFWWNFRLTHDNRYEWNKLTHSTNELCSRCQCSCTNCCWILQLNNWCCGSLRMKSSCAGCMNYSARTKWWKPSSNTI